MNDKAPYFLLELRETFADGTLVLRGGGWTISPFEYGDGFAITPPVVPQADPFAAAIANGSCKG